MTAGLSPAPFGLLALASLVLAGCAGGGGLDVADDGRITFPGHPGIVASFAAEDGGDAVVVTVTLRNGSGRTYGIKDDCSEQWLRIRVTGAAGGEVYPGPVAVCDLYSVPGPLAAGEVRTKSARWEREVQDGDAGGYRAAPAGDYVLHVQVRLYAEPRDGAASFTGEARVPVTVR